MVDPQINLNNLVAARKVYCNRTLNMRSIQAIGYDMDYTLVHYRVEEWEQRAYQYLKDQLISQGWPIHALEFDPKRVCRGLILDIEKGNLIKANRFGFVKHAMHGTQSIDFESQRDLYSRIIVDLSEKRWIFLNTLFSLSEGCMYAQLVDLLDQRLIPEVLGYGDLYERVKTVLETAHMEGRLKAEIIGDPDRFVILDKETPLTLLDQHYSGKKLMLITNSEWHYTMAMMTYSFDRFLPHGIKWNDLFDLVVVGAGKPYFFTSHHSMFEVATPEGLLRPSSGNLKRGTSYLGGSARQVENYLGLSGDEILYVGDHMFGDVHVTKNVLSWRTALIVRELEEELSAVEAFSSDEMMLAKLMKEKENLEVRFYQLKIELQRRRHQYGPQQLFSETELELKMSQLRGQVDSIDASVALLARAARELSNPTWGLLMRAGNDKSYLAYQLERYADIYTSRVSNLLWTTPFAYLRSSRGSLPHDLDFSLR